MKEAQETQNVAQAEQSGSLQSAVDALVMPMPRKKLEPTERLVHAIAFHVAAYGCPADEAFLVDVLADKCGLTRNEATAVIDMAELDGKVTHHGGSRGPHRYSVPVEIRVELPGVGLMA